jgi:hypothetical protein
VDPGRDKSVFVLDQAHLRGGDYDPSGHLVEGSFLPKYPRKYYHTTFQEAERAYMDSKVPLQTYLEKEKQLGYSLPEVIFMEDVPLDRVHVADKQPKLAEELDSLPPGNETISIYRRTTNREQMMEAIRHVPGLEEWYRRYEIKAKPREDEKPQGHPLLGGKSDSREVAQSAIQEQSTLPGEASRELDRAMKSPGTKAVLLVAGGSTETRVQNFFKGSPVTRVCLSSTTDRGELLARTVTETNGSPQWANGPLTEAMEQGKPLVLDGLESASREIVKLLRVVTRFGQLPLADRGLQSDGTFATVKAQEGFKLLGTFNPGGAAGIKELPGEVRDIFDVQVNLGGLPNLSPAQPASHETMARHSSL